jgi:hypothetical protein
VPPFGSLDPDQLPEAVQEVALVTVQSRMVDWPEVEREEGVAERDDGLGEGGWGGRGG